MRALLLASLTLALVLAAPGAAAGSLDASDGPGPGGACDGLVDTLCHDPWGQPNGTICLLAVGGHCLAWV